MNESKNSIEEIFISLEKEFQFSIDYLKETIGTVCYKIENQIQYIKDEIDVRIESIKIELDKLSDSLKKDLDDSKDELMGQVECIDVDEYENELKSICVIIEDKQKSGQSQKNFEKFQSSLIHLNKVTDYLKNLDCQITFNINQSKIEQNLIGSIIYNYRYNHEIKNLNVRIKSGKYTTIRNNNIKNADISGLCALPNGNLLTLNFLRRSLTIYDSEFQIVKEAQRDHNIFKNICDISCATTNNLDKIYITDNNLVIIVTDLELNIINTVGTKDANPKQFYNHRGICYYNNYVYVCDTRNQKIQRLTANLELEAVYALDFRPVQIKISNNNACIVPSILDECESIYFYDLLTFNLKFKYDGHYGMVEVINSYFYEFCDEDRKIYCYDQHGILYDEIQTYFDRSEYECFNAITYFNEKFLLYSEPKFVLI